MKARMPAGYGRPDPNAMMRQVQKMQEAIKTKTEELENTEFTGTASGEMVTVTMTGKHQITAGRPGGRCGKRCHSPCGRDHRKRNGQDHRRAEYSRPGLIEHR